MRLSRRIHASTRYSSTLDEIRSGRMGKSLRGGHPFQGEGLVGMFASRLTCGLFGSGRNW
ncbi:hypothetical protein KEM55_008884 [Ascosphaera atra]|nr:hypothetical protein KEM55_008884 [Ascosphaera atra]